METVTVERVIAAPIDEVFDWCATTTNYTRSPVVLRARLATPGADAPWGVGAIRLHTFLVGWFRERITAYNPPYSFDYLIERSVPPAHHELGRLTFTEVPGGTRVLWTSTVELRFPFAAAALTRLLAPRMVGFAFGSILKAANADLTARRHRTEPTTA